MIELLYTNSSEKGLLQARTRVQKSCNEAGDRWTLQCVFQSTQVFPHKRRNDGQLSILPMNYSPCPKLCYFIRVIYKERNISVPYYPRVNPIKEEHNYGYLG
jgi:hypothetical protein